MNFFYKLLINGITTNLDLKIAEAIKVLDGYSFFNDKDKLAQVLIDRFYEEQELYIKKVKGNKTVYDLFFFNFHIHVSVSDNEKIYSIRLKKNDEYWRFDKIEDEIDFSHPLNQTYEVYVWYEVPVLDITKSIGCLYKSGSWNKYFYQTVNKFIKNVDAITDKSKFNEYYK